MNNSAHAALPVGFTDSLVATLRAPTALAFTPDQRLLITTQLGSLRIYQNGALLPAAALDLGASERVCTDSERGLLGVAVDPNFATSHYIFLYYTYNKFATCVRNDPASPVNRVVRYILGNDNRVDPASETVLIDNIPSPNGNHNAGDLNFGQDGLLYVSVGDGGCDYLSDSGCGGANNASLDRNVLLGKILRITSSGAIPFSNPFQGAADSARCNVAGRTTPGKNCQETYSFGLRNPFRVAFDRNFPYLKFFINDMGQGQWEEIDYSKIGANYGWNLREGPCPNGLTSNCATTPAGLTNPIYSYQHNLGCTSITGGAFVPRALWPATYDGSYLFGDYVCNRIFQLVVENGKFVAHDFATGLGVGGPVHMLFGPNGASQALYYTTYAAGGEVHRIAYTGAANRAPTAQATVTPRFGPLPLAVSFDASASSDPDADTLTYQWQFGDGTPDQSGVRVSHTYQTAGAFFPVLQVQDSRGATSLRTLRVDPGHAAPKVTILSPTSATRYKVGENLVLRASAVDEQGHTLPDSALQWQVQLHHDTHVHPYLSLTTGNNIPLVAPAPEDLAAVNTSYLTITWSSRTPGVWLRV